MGARFVLFALSALFGMLLVSCSASIATPLADPLPVKCADGYACPRGHECRYEPRRCVFVGPTEAW